MTAAFTDAIGLQPGNKKMPNAVQRTGAKVGKALGVKPLGTDAEERERVEGREPKKPAKYAAGDEEKKPPEEESPAEEAPAEEAPPHEAPPVEDGDAGGEMPPAEAAPVDDGSMPPDDQAAQGDMGAEEAPPEGHDWFLQNIRYAIQNGTSPELYGMAQHYAEMMAQQAGGDEMQDVPPEMAGAEQEAAPGGDQQAADEQAAQEAMSGGAEEMPPPGSEEQNYADEDGAMGGKLPGGGLHTPKGLGSNLVPGWDTVGNLAKGKVGSALQSVRLGATPGVSNLQNDKTPQTYQGGASPMANETQTMPVTYQAALQQLEHRFNTRLTKLEKENKGKDQIIQSLQAKNARAESEGLVTQLQYAGVEALIDGQRAEELVQYFASLPPDQRQSKFDEINTFWKKDETAAAAARGAPVGDFLQTYQGPSEGGAGADTNKKGLLTEGGSKKVLDFLRTPQGKRMRSEGKSMDEIKQYALNGDGGQGPTTYQSNGTH